MSGFTNPLKVALLIAILLAAPGCASILRLPIQLVSAAFDVLFFWADAPDAAEPDPDAPALAAMPASPADPVPLAVAVGRAFPLAAYGALFILPADTPLPPADLQPPSVGARPVAILISDRHLSPEAEKTLEKAEIRLVRPAFSAARAAADSGGAPPGR